MLYKIEDKDAVKYRIAAFDMKEKEVDKFCFNFEEKF